MNPFWRAFSALFILSFISAGAAPAAEKKGRELTPREGFVIEEILGRDRIASVLCLTFDRNGRPVMGLERDGIRIGEFDASRRKIERLIHFSDQVASAQGLCFVGPGDLLAHGSGPEGAGLYRLRDQDGDDRADEISFLAKGEDEITEHGPHAIHLGPDGCVYLLYGNYSRLEAKRNPRSPSRGLKEDFLLPRFVDPRGHSTEITAPGGTIMRLDLGTMDWTQIAGGLRNPYDFVIDHIGEIFIFESDMEWDVGLPWYRPTRVLHVVPGGDYGWRTGSAKMPEHYFDTLPSIEPVGRGSPSGMALYKGNEYPEEYRGALFLGDWSRGTIRVMKLRRAGATYEGKSEDFITGKPLNVTSMAVHDGLLYFVTGGRLTSGGLYRVRYSGPAGRSPGLAAEQKTGRESQNVTGPGESESDALERRAAEVFRLGFTENGQARLQEALKDPEPLIIRKACEGLQRQAQLTGGLSGGAEAIAKRSLELLGHEDRFVRYCARVLVRELDRETWKGEILKGEGQVARARLEGLLVLIQESESARDFEAIFDALGSMLPDALQGDLFMDYLRAAQLAFIRNQGGTPGKAFGSALGPRLLSVFPAADPAANRELQILLAHLQPEGAIEKMLDYLTADKPQEEQIHTMYCLRAMERNWTAEQRRRAVAWFDRGGKFRGAVSMEGYLYFMWEGLLAHLPPVERDEAEARRQRAIEERERKIAALLNDAQPSPWRTDGAQMTFEEIALYLENDPMAFAKANAKRGGWVFHRAKCADCHLFGTEGRGGGPDLSTVINRMTRREILESIMYPSRVISDQYTTLNVETKKGETISGMLVGESRRALTLIDATGKRIDLPKREIASRQRSAVSVMPEGLIDAMNLHDIVDLFAFLEDARP